MLRCEKAGKIALLGYHALGGVMSGSTISGTVSVGVTLGSNYLSPLTITTVGDVHPSGDYANAIYAPVSLLSASITNDGAISSSDISSIAIELRCAASLTNSGSIHGGIYLRDGGEVLNTGSIFAFDGFGIYLAAGGSVSNGGLISGGADGLVPRPGASVYLAAGGTVSNSGTILASFGFPGAAGVLADAGGVVRNTGVIIGGAGSASGGSGGAAVQITNGTLTNYGTLASAGAAAAGGAAVNQFGGTTKNFGLVVGGYGAPAEVAAGDGGAGLVLSGAGVFTNAGTLAGGAGIYQLELGGGLGGAGATIDSGVLINTGQIIGGQGGYNRYAGTANSDAGVYIDGGTVIDAGIIEGGAPGAIQGGNNGEPGNAVLFGTAGGALTLQAGGLNLPGAIGGFAAGDTIVLDGFSETDFQYVTGAGAELHQGSTAISLDIEGRFSTGDFIVVTLGGDTTISLPGTVSMPCFTAGTRILTPRGEVPVQALAVGDAVITYAGEDRKIIWIGARLVDVLRHDQPELVRPVIIEPDALADGVPARQLTVSPDHALLLDGVLVQAKDLVNGVSIHADAGARLVHYYHIELANHDILLAEGAAAESFLDTGHRALFAGEDAVCPPDVMQRRREIASCATLCGGGEALAAIRASLAARITIVSRLDCFASLAMTM